MTPDTLLIMTTKYYCLTMQPIKLLMLASIALLTMTSCSTFVVPQVDLANGQYPTNFELRDEEILNEKAHDNISSVKYLVLINHTSTRADFKNKSDIFLKQSLTNMGFKNIISENDFLLKIHSLGLSKGVLDIYSKDSLHRINDHSGPFLLMTAQFGTAGYGKAKIKIFDPKTKQTLYQSVSKSFVFKSYDQQVLYPIINAINNWYKLSLAKQSESIK